MSHLCKREQGSGTWDLAGFGRSEGLACASYRHYHLGVEILGTGSQGDNDLTSINQILNEKKNIIGT